MFKKTKYGKGICLFFTISIIFILLVFKVEASPGWLSGWQYRKQHNITGSTAGNQTNYPIRIKVHYRDAFIPIWDSGVLAPQTNNARNIVIDGNYLYAVAQQYSTYYSFVIYDISDPSSPVQKSILATGNNCHDIRKSGNYVFIGGTTGVLVYNVTNPSSPSLVKNHNLGGDVHGMFLLGNYLYCCLYLNDEFTIVDITDPENPVTKGSVTDVTYVHGPHDVHVEGDYAYLANYEDGTGEYGFVVINVSNKSSPSVVAWDGEGHLNSHIIKVGNYCYVGSHQPDTGMTIYNVSTPTSPVYVGKFFSDKMRNFGYWNDLYNATTLATTGVRDDDQAGVIHLIDISNPTSPTILMTYEQPTNDHQGCVKVTGEYIYVSVSKDYPTREWVIRSYKILEAGEAEDELVSLDEKCKTDFGDVRFTGEDGETEYSYYLDPNNGADGDYRYFYVKLPTISNVTINSIYVYYGNSDATTTSSGENTFIFFDDFDNLDKWDVTGDASVSDGICTVGDAVTDWDYIWANTTYQFGRPLIYEVYMKIDAVTTTGWHGAMIRDTGTNDLIFHGLYQTGATTGTRIRIETINYDYHYTPKYSDEYYIYTTWWKTDGVSFWIDGTPKYNSTYTSTRTDLRPRADSYWANKFVYLDWIRIRNYVEPEPSHGDWGAEESLSSDGESCTFNWQCSGGYCVHGICRSSSTYCGDGYCDTGEDCSNCEVDCACSSDYYCSDGQCTRYIRGACKKEDQTCLRNASCCSGMYCLDGICKNITIAPEEVPSAQECPACPECSGWSDCIDNKQTMTCYSCDETTNYTCQSYTKTIYCVLKEEVIPREKPHLDILYRYWYVWLMIVMVMVFIVILFYRLKTLKY